MFEQTNEFKKSCKFLWDKRAKKYEKKNSTLRIMATNGVKDECIAEK
jgi:hypothetical protein